MSRKRQMEEYRTAVILVTFISLISQISAKKQSEALSHIYKLNNKIDRSHFNASNDVLHEAEVYSQQGLKENDRIQRLPGQPEVQFNQYGGYVTVNRTTGRAFYYYFAEAHHSHNSLPLLLWLNGGPGCSSLGYGAMQELGPFHVYSDGKTLYQNNFSWNHAANVLFVESPAGVGFSYSNTTEDLMRNGDRGTAIDNYGFLVNWLERFPEYKSRDLYIAGESYAGHFVPQLAHTILYHNHNPGSNIVINLKGIIIGNGYINYETDTRGMYEYYGSHALVSDETTDQIMKYCDFSLNNNREPHKCIDALIEVNHNIALIDNYNIYAPLCINSGHTQNTNMTSVMNVDPCSENYVDAYLNRVEVQKALHANVTNIPYRWEHCSNAYMHWHDAPVTVLPLLKELTTNGLRVWIYSGDTDGNVPVTSTKNSIKELKLPIKTSWHPWYLSEYEVGGYTQVYEGELTFATVRGAGHEVPSYQPAAALSLIMHFLAGTQLPNSSTN